MTQCSNIQKLSICQNVCQFNCDFSSVVIKERRLKLYDDLQMAKGNYYSFDYLRICRIIETTHLITCEYSSDCKLFYSQIIFYCMHL